MMKRKSIIGFVLLFGIAFISVASVDAAPRYWEHYLRSIAEKYNRLDLIPRYSAKATRNYNNSIRHSFPRKVSGSTKNYQTGKINLGNSSNRTYVRSTFPRKKTTTITSNSKILSSIRPLTLSKDITRISTDPIDVFEISFVNKNKRSSTRFNEALYVNELKFSLLENSGVTENFSNFLLSVEGTDFRFDRNGSVTLKFGNLRLSSGETSSIKVSLRIDDPSSIAHISGSMRIRLDDANARTELAGNVFDIGVSGTRISDLLAFNPTPESFGNPTFSGLQGVNIYGKMLTAGSSEMVLATGLKAVYDDLYIDEITLHDTVSANAVDIFINKVEAISGNSGKILGTTRFSNGRARFRFPKRIFVRRDREEKIFFKVYLNEKIPANFVNTRFRLNINPSDVSVQSASSGNYLSNANKSFSIENETFTVVGTSINVVSETKQNRDLVIGAGHQLVHKISISGGGNNSADIARVSFQVSPHNIAFLGGISADDFELVRIVGNQEIPLPTSSILSGSVIRFDLNNHLIVYRSQDINLGLRIALEDNGASPNLDSSVTIKVLGDTSFQRGTLSTVKSSNANFIWSDRSASPHSATSSDWSNGYLLPGIPASSLSYKRDW